jgi:L-idonate 5-dehydrogenase
VGQDLVAFSIEYFICEATSTKPSINLLRAACWDSAGDLKLHVRYHNTPNPFAFITVIHAQKDLRLDQLPEPDAPGPDQVLLAFGAGGICGSDLSYFNKGRVGDFNVRQPLCLGHEFAGSVLALGSNVTDLKVGDRVAVNPNHPCRVCKACMAGKGNLCYKMQFFGSAAVFPHIQGVFRERLLVDSKQCYRVSRFTDFRIAAMAEPLAVSLHAVARAGALVGKEVLITGGGPIGCLVLLAARNAGAKRIVVTEVSDKAIGRLSSLPADDIINTMSDTEKMDIWQSGKGHFDIAFECSGNPAALASAIRATASGGKVVVVGMVGMPEVPLPVNPFVAREVDLIGSFRFDPEFGQAVDLLVRDQIDVRPIMTHSFPMRAAQQAFMIASDRDESLKVHLTSEASH